MRSPRRRVELPSQSDLFVNEAMARPLVHPEPANWHELREVPPMSRESWMSASAFAEWLADQEALRAEGLASDEQYEAAQGRMAMHLHRAGECRAQAEN